MPDHLIRTDGSPFPAAELEAIARELDALDTAEREAFRTANAEAIAALPSGRTLIVSGPGTGKSRLFVRRIKNWLRANPTAGVLVTSFVRKLVRDLERDVSDDTTLSEDQRRRVRALTLHKLARSLVEQNHGTREWPFRPHFRIIAGPWREVVWQDVLAMVPAAAGSETTLDVFNDYLHQGEPSEAPLLRDLRAAYFELCQFYNAAGFADLIIRARVAVEENPDLVPERHFIVDEFQDFNLAEEAFINALTGSASGLLIAGDDDQVLYEGLKAGTPAIIRALYQNPGTANAMLPYCSRCNYHITRASAHFMQAHADDHRIRKVFLPLSNDSGCSRVNVIACAAPGTAVQFVAEWLRERREAIEVRQRELDERTEKNPYVLVLAPSTALRFLGKARDAFWEEIAKHRTGGGAPFSEDYFNVAVLFSVGRRPEDNFDCRKGLHLIGASVARVHDLIEVARARSINLCDLDAPEIHRVVRLGRDVQAACQAEADPARLVRRLAKLLEVADRKRLAADLAARPLSASAIEALRQEQDDVAEVEESRVAAHAVEVMSIVGAKGLTADHVIILGCDNVSMAYLTPKAFFVGLTRARESLQLVVNLRAVGATGAHQRVMALPRPHVRFHKYTQKDGLARFGSMAEFTGFLDYLAGLSRRQ
jgi:superfamily I DNA/RNA helicase